MPDFGIMEAITALGSFLAEGATGVGSALGIGGTAGAAGAGGAAATGAGLGAAGTTSLAAGGAGALGAGLDAALSGGAGTLIPGGAAATGAGLGGLEALGLGTTAATGGLGPLASTGAEALGGGLNLGNLAAPTAGGAVTAAPSAIASAPTAIGDFTGAGGAGNLGDIGGLADLSKEGLGGGLDSAFSGSSAPFGTLGNEGLASGAIAPVEITPAAASIDLAGPGSSIDALLADPGIGTTFNALKANSDWMVPAAGLAYSGTQSMMAPGEKELKAQAASLMAQSSDLRNGALPAGVRAGLHSAGERAKAAMRSMFASKGLSGSSSEVSTLASIDQTVANQGAELAMKMIQTGVTEANLSSQLYTSIMNQALQRDAQLGSAIGRFGMALAGGNPYAKAA